MKIIDKIKNSKKISYSFEFFPPKTLEGEEKLLKVVEELKPLQPNFISVTYGAGGSTRDKTFQICDIIQNNMNITTMCHYTCVGSGKSEIEKNLEYLESKKIDNIIALRGDPPKGEGKFVKHPEGFSNATELIQFIKSKKYQFCLAGGCYPEKHPDSPTLELDVENLKKKVDSGAQFLITQLFFQNSKFENFLNLTKKVGINVPILPGIMPITNFKQIERFKELADCEIPIKLIDNLEKFKDNQAEFLKYSYEFSTEQCRELMKMNIEGIHFYTLNQSKATIEIMKAL